MPKEPFVSMLTNVPRERLIVAQIRHVKINVVGMCASVRQGTFLQQADDVRILMSVAYMIITE